jgi:hypothetical protein
MENQLVPKAGHRAGHHRLQRPARQGPAAHGHRRRCACSRPSGTAWASAPARRQRGAGHGRLRVLSGWADGQPAEQAADAGERRRRAAAVQPQPAAGGRPRGLRLRRRAAAQRTKNAVVTGNPVRAEIEALPAPEQRLAGRSGPLRLLVVGGSLGAQVLNSTVPAALALLPAAQRPLVTHQTGNAHFADRERRLRRRRCRRRGAALHRRHGRPAGRLRPDAVPRRCHHRQRTVRGRRAVAAGAADRVHHLHQRDNAQHMAGTAPPCTCRKAELTAQTLAAALQGLTRDKLLDMAVKARALARPRAARAWPTRWKRWQGRARPRGRPDEARPQAHPLRGHRRRRHERHRRDAARAGFHACRAATRGQRHHAAAAAAGPAHRHRPRGAAHRRRAGAVVSSRRQGRQPRGAGRPRAPHAGGARAP